MTPYLRLLLTLMACLTVFRGEPVRACQAPLTATTSPAGDFRDELAARRGRVLAFGEDELRTFWNEGWTYAAGAPADANVEVYGLFRETVVAVEALTDSRADLSTKLEALIGPLEWVPRHVVTLKGDNHRHLKAAAGAFRSLAILLALRQHALGQPVTLDPFRPMTEAWMIDLIDGLQLLRLNLTRSKKPLCTAGPKQRVTRESGDFAGLLSNARPAISPENEYRVTLACAHTRAETSLAVTLSKSVAEELGGRHSRQALRLLRSLVIAQTPWAGLKSLETVGKNIVELKAVMRGHWRIIGCLEGDRLRLLTLVHLPESIQAYARRIPADLCTSSRRR